MTIQTEISAPLQTVWNYWTMPENITRWNFAVPEWHCPAAENDLRVGGKFTSRMEARDGSFGFDFGGTHDEVEPLSKIVSTLGDGRKMTVYFVEQEGKTIVSETFDTEDVHSEEQQRQGWQAILDNFKTYVEIK